MSALRIFDYAGKPALMHNPQYGISAPIIMSGKIVQNKNDRVPGVYEIIDDQIVVSCPICKSLIFISLSDKNNNKIITACYVCDICQTHHQFYLEGYNCSWKLVQDFYPKKREPILFSPSYFAQPQQNKEMVMNIIGGFYYTYVKQSMRFVKRSEEELIQLGQLIDKKFHNDDNRLFINYTDYTHYSYPPATTNSWFYAHSVTSKYFDRMQILDYLLGTGSLKDIYLDEAVLKN